MSEHPELEALPEWPTRTIAAFTARGRARIAQEPLAGAPDYVAIAVDVDHVDDHRKAEFLLDSGVDRRRVGETEQRALGERVAALRDLAASRA